MLLHQVPEGTFVVTMEFSPLKAGAEPSFLEWFRKTSLVYARHPGFLGRYLLKPEKDGETYRRLVFHQSMASFMAMHTSPDRAEAWKVVEPSAGGQAPRPVLHHRLIAASRPLPPGWQTPGTGPSLGLMGAAGGVYTARESPRRLVGS